MKSVKMILRADRILAVFFLLLIPSFLSARDWTKDPAFIVIPYAPNVVAVGDIHGSFEEMAASLDCLGVAKRTVPDSFRLKWTGGRTILIFTGDLNDRGLHTREVYDAVMDLENQAAEEGGRVIALLGNHEVLLLNGTVEKWAKTLQPPKNQHYQNTIDSFTRAGLDFHEAISPGGRYGSWIRRRPLFAIVNGFLFVHGGLEKEPRSREAVAGEYMKLVEKEAWNEGLMMAEKGLLWHREWWNDSALVEKGLEAMKVRGVVFGHTIGAMGIEGNINVKDSRLIGIDTGMCPVFGKSKGSGLKMTVTPSGRLVFTAHYPDRPTELLFHLDYRKIFSSRSEEAQKYGVKDGETALPVCR